MAAALDAATTIALAGPLVAALARAAPDNAALAPAAAALALPQPHPAAAAALPPAYFLLLCDKAFALLDALHVSGELRAARKALLAGLQAAERSAEAWARVYVAPAPALSAAQVAVERCGQRVRLVGLPAPLGAAGANGALGEVTAGSAVDGRCTVRVLACGTMLKVKPEHLEPV